MVVGRGGGSGGRRGKRAMWMWGDGDGMAISARKGCVGVTYHDGGGGAGFNVFARGCSGLKCDILGPTRTIGEKILPLVTVMKYMKRSLLPTRSWDAI